MTTASMVALAVVGHDHRRGRRVLPVLELKRLLLVLLPQGRILRPLVNLGLRCHLQLPRVLHLLLLPNDPHLRHFHNAVDHRQDDDEDSDNKDHVDHLVAAVLVTLDLPDVVIRHHS